MAAARELEPASVGSVEAGRLRLGDFCGQKLVVLFCPGEGAAAAAERAAFEARAEAFQREGAWLIAVSKAAGPCSPHGNGHVKTVVDPDGLAFQILAAGFPPEMTDTDGAVVFLVDRDGIARHVWAGAGRVEDVLAGVRERP